MRIRPLILSSLVVILLCPGWTGAERVPLLGPARPVLAEPIALLPGSARRRVGRLTYLGGVALRSDDPAFGGFSSMSVAGDRFTLLSDSGNIVRFRMDADWRPVAVRFANLAAGPGSGWQKRERDSEAMAVDPATGTTWIGFERYNQIWRFGPDLTLPAQGAAPPAMHRWNWNSGPETMARLPDGRFLVIAEGNPDDGWPGRPAILFSGDPVANPRSGFRLRYLPPRGGLDPSDAVMLPDGRHLLVVNRAFEPPFIWRAMLTLVDLADARPGAVLRGREVARFAAPLTVDNFEALAITREGGDVILWMASDDNQSWLQRSLLLKFRIDPALLTPRPEPRRPASS